MHPDEVKALIAGHLPQAEVRVGGDGRHFEAVVVCDAFAGKSMIQRHQMVYRTLGGKMGNEIHALSLRTLAPGE